MHTRKNLKSGTCSLWNLWQTVSDGAVRTSLPRGGTVYSVLLARLALAMNWLYIIMYTVLAPLSLESYSYNAYTQDCVALAEVRQYDGLGGRLILCWVVSWRRASTIVLCRSLSPSPESHVLCCTCLVVLFLWEERARVVSNLYSI